ncbi:MAG: TIGR00730 family Rossman fold protein [Acetobacteraceae bacterium]|nr:TIGR00730 family Rossman fold protein [Acetobacteraceae bacterium]
MPTDLISSLRSVAVFCGSRFGLDPAYRRAAEALGAGLAAAGLRLVYGGGRVGLMGVVADAALAGGGQVLGVIPDFLQRREVAHGGPVELVITETMHDRKRQMFAAADAFVMMPGGFGTFDETIEITTWRQLGLHDKPVLICDVEGWAQPYVDMLKAAIRHGFAEPSTAFLYEVLPDVPSVLARLETLARPGVGQPEKV